MSIITRFLHVGKTFAKKMSRIHMYRNTVPPRLICHHVWEKQDKWMAGKKEVNLKNNKQPFGTKGYTVAASFLNAKLAFL